LIGWSGQSVPVAWRVCFSRKRHSRRQHSFEPAHPIAQIGEFLTHSCHINRGVAYTLVQEDDLA